MNFRNLIHQPIKSLLGESLTKIYDYLDTIVDPSYDDVISALESFDTHLFKTKQLESLEEYLSSPGIKQKLIKSGLQKKKFDKFLLLVTLGSVVESDISFSASESCTLNVNDFQLFKDEAPVMPFKVFGFYNDSNKIDTLAYFDFSEVWKNQVADSGVNKHIIACTIYAINNLRSFNINYRYILSRKDAKSKFSRQSALRLQAVVHGKPIHKPEDSDINASKQSTNKISALNNYQQFNESMIILSEYRAQNEVMHKFLSLFQVLENFMHRIPIVELTSTGNGEMFSIRRFKSLYRSVAQGDTETFKKRFQSYDAVLINGKKLNKIINDAVKSLETINGFEEKEFDELLENLDLKSLSYTNFKKSFSNADYAVIIYKLRCCIVHNNETEFHLSHFNLNKTIKITLDYLFIDILEKLVLSLIVEKNQIVWYQKDNLKLIRSS